MADETVVPGETPPTQEPAQSDNGATPDVAKLQADNAELRSALSRANSESAERRIKLKEFEEAEAKRKEAEMSEVEKAKAQAAEAQQKAEAAIAKAREARAGAEIAKAAAKAGVDADLVSRLVTVEFDAEGEPQNVEAAIAKVLETYPQLKAPTSAANPTNPGRKSALTKEQIAKMTPAQINERWDEVQRVMAGG